MALKSRQILCGKGCLLIAFGFLFFIFAFTAHAQTLQVGITGSGTYQDSITVQQGTPLELKWSFPASFTKCKFPGNFGWPFGTSGTYPVNAWTDKTYTLTCCDKFLGNNFCTGNKVSDTATINVTAPLAGNQIYWDYSICDKKTTCKGMLVSAEAGYTQNNAKNVYNNLWPASPLTPNWLPSLNAWVGIYYDSGRNIGVIQIVYLDGHWLRGYVYSQRNSKAFLQSAWGVWGDNNFLNCNPQSPSGNNQIVWGCGKTTGLSSNLSCSATLPFLTSSGAINSPSTVVTRRTSCDLWGGIFGQSWGNISIKNKGMWWNNLSGGIPGWLLTDASNILYSIRQDGIWTWVWNGGGGPLVLTGPWALKSGSHLACTESKTCQVVSGLGPDECFTQDSPCGTPLDGLKAFCEAKPPSSISAPLNGVSVTAWTEGTALGDITYKFYCDASGPLKDTKTIFHDPNNPDPAEGTSYTDPNICDYSTNGIHTIKVEASRSGLNSVANCSVNVGGGGSPKDPSNLLAAASSCSKINVTWKDNATDENGFKVERSENDPSFASPTVINVLAHASTGNVSYQDAGLKENTTYYYRVRAFNSFGNSGYSNSDSAATGACPNVDLEIKGPTGNWSDGPIAIDRNENVDLRWVSGGGADICQGSWSGVGLPANSNSETIPNIINTTTFNIYCCISATNECSNNDSATVFINFSPSWKEIIPW